MDTAVLRDIHRFWFGAPAAPDDLPSETLDRWFRRSEETDRTIRERFGAFIPEAATVAWDLGGLTREEAVALVVLFDQFPRNIFRASAEAFAYDAKAREVARGLMALGWARFHWVERSAIAIPFEHSEEVADQDYSVMLCAELAVAAPESLREFTRIFLDYACRHRDTIRRFGRFPHRNAVLGRVSTPEEVAFLAEKSEGF